MDHLRALPVKRPGELPIIPTDGPAKGLPARRAAARDPPVQISGNLRPLMCGARVSQTL
jgi:hypothetical protein